ncbi:hypothetical protein SteCoe_19813 [Stentor coeruleus]|uniref:Uncharacterized protein n=1 Tax=Stentor coeruleus TaxID=5963 RepID=A0A1R2BTF5_9CILI|nr:hypothetical protein SteCoe_19813 [Stentor coeruleus]
MERNTYYKQVACIDSRFFSIIDPKVEYILGETLHQKVEKNHKGGFFVYSSPELAVNAQVALKLGSNWIFPRSVLKVHCWGDFIQYPKFKLCFEYIKPIEILGFPRQYLTSSNINWHPSTSLGNYGQTLNKSLISSQDSVRKEAQEILNRIVLSESSSQDIRSETLNTQKNCRKPTSSLMKMREETKKLELEVQRMEQIMKSNI